MEASRFPEYTLKNAPEVFHTFQRYFRTLRTDNCGNYFLRSKMLQKRACLKYKTIDDIPP